MISTTALAEFLAARGITERVVPDGRVPDNPNRIVILTPTGGPGRAVDGLFDVASVQVRTVGDQDDHLSAENLARRVDRALLDARQPITVGGAHVSGVNYLGGPPAFLERDLAGRSHLVCVYLITLARVPV